MSSIFPASLAADYFTGRTPPVDVGELMMELLFAQKKIDKYL